MDAVLDSELLSGQADRVKAHGMQHVEPAHPLVPAEDVRGDVAQWVPDVQADARGIGKHVQAIELGLVRIEAGIAGVGRHKGVVLVPVGLPACLDDVCQPCRVPEGVFAVGWGGGGGLAGVGCRRLGHSSFIK